MHKIKLKYLINGIINLLRNKYYTNQNGIKCEKNIFISKNVELDNVELGDYCNVAHHAQISGSKIGKRTSVGRYSKIRDAIIGSYCSISWDVTIGAVNHPLNTISTHAFVYKKQFGIVMNDSNIPKEYVKIGHDVWIGCNAIILPGINIGNGAIIGAGAVVTHNVEPYSIVIGSPAKHIRYRFEKEVCKGLDSVKWWDLPDEIIKNNIEIFKTNVDDNIISTLKEIYNSSIELENTLNSTNSSEINSSRYK